MIRKIINIFLIIILIMGISGCGKPNLSEQLWDEDLIIHDGTAIALTKDAFWWANPQRKYYLVIRITREEYNNKNLLNEWKIVADDIIEKQ